ncbi:MAG TPA: KTSC domain-containing protein [Chitinophagaceae bacterium]
MPSSVILKYEYNEAAEVLTITFISGKVYDYLAVPKAVYERMRATVAKGIFFNREIKDRFECVKH